MHRTARRPRVVIAALTIATALAACGGGGGSSSNTAAGNQPVGTQNTDDTAADAGEQEAGAEADPAAAGIAAAAATPTEPPAPPAPVAPPPPLSQVQGVSVKLELIPGTDDLKLLTSTTTRSDGTIYFGHQEGRISKLAPDGTISQVLDITNEVEPYQAGSERGFLGIIMSPDESRIFTYFTDNNQDSNLRSYAVDAAGNIDPTTRLDVLFVPQPGLGHKGGGMVFLPDGTLMLALGDGGGSRGRDAQDYTKALGGIIRVLPNPDSNGYTIPADNPYVDSTDGTLKEIWAKGLRNPWGFHFDEPTGELWLGDVGERDWEEFNSFPWNQGGGYNFGWYYIEGNLVHYSDHPSDVRAPTFAYAHNDIGPAVIGGYIYRGNNIPGLQGAYIFADMSGKIFGFAEGQPVHLTNHNAVITAWGRDAAGEPIMLAQRNGVYRLVPA